MGLTHDGLQSPLPPSRLWQLVGVLVLIGGVALCTRGGAWWCGGLSTATIGLLMVGNQFGGVTRIRVTFSKLLVEDERPVMGFLIGPSKRRIPWEEYVGVEVTGGRVVAKGGPPGGKGAPVELVLGEGATPAELDELARKIRDAAERFKAEGGAEGV